MPNPNADTEVTTEYMEVTADMEAICFHSNAWNGTFIVIKLAKDVAPEEMARSIASFQKHQVNMPSA